MSLFKNRTVIGLVCIVISLFICFGLAPYFNRGASKKVEVIRVKKEIKAGDKIRKDMIEKVEVGGFNLEKDLIRTEESVVDTYALADLFIGDYILSSKLSKEMAADNTYLYSLDGSQQAISITIKNFANGLSGKIKSGDIVSVIANNYRDEGLTLIPAELKYVEVISVTSSSGYDANTKEADDEEEKELPATITLLINEEQGNILANLEAEGEAHIVLVYRGDKKEAEEFLQMQDLALKEIKEKREAILEEEELPFEDINNEEVYLEGNVD